MINFYRCAEEPIFHPNLIEKLYSSIWLNPSDGWDYK